MCRCKYTNLKLMCAVPLLVLLTACVKTSNVPIPDAYIADVVKMIAPCPNCRRDALELAADRMDESVLGIAEMYANDDDYYVRTSCWFILMQVESQAQADWIERGLSRLEPGVRAYAMRAIGRLEAGDSRDRLLARAIDGMATEQHGYVIDGVSRTCATVGTASNAKDLWRALEPRGSEWCERGLAAYAAFPNDDNATVLREASESSIAEIQILGRRGLKRLLGVGAVSPDNELDCLTVDEFALLWEQARRPKGVPSLVDWYDMLHEIERARVVVVGETHSSVPVRAWQIRILGDLAAAKPGRVGLVAEVPMLKSQASLIEAARLGGVEVRWIEQDTGRRRAAHARDLEARERLLAEVEANPEKTFIVCYGDGHRASFAAKLREAGIATVEVTLSGSHGFKSSAVTSMRNLDIRGKVFRYHDGTYYVPVGFFPMLLEHDRGGDGSGHK